MDEIVKAVFAAPLANLFIVAGIIFLFIAVLGNVSGKIEPGAKGRIISEVLGLAFVIAGIVMHLSASLPPPIDPRCQSYAQEAIQQYKKGVDLKCNYTGARWQDYYENHYKWCLSVPYSNAEAENQYPPS